VWYKKKNPDIQNKSYETGISIINLIIILDKRLFICIRLSVCPSVNTYYSFNRIYSISRFKPNSYGFDKITIYFVFFDINYLYNIIVIITLNVFGDLKK